MFDLSPQYSRPFNGHLDSQQNCSTLKKYTTGKIHSIALPFQKYNESTRK
jgi:hypothetical protein